MLNRGNRPVFDHTTTLLGRRLRTLLHCCPFDETCNILCIAMRSLTAPRFFGLGFVWLQLGEVKRLKHNACLINVIDGLIAKSLPRRCNYSSIPENSDSILDVYVSGLCLFPRNGRRSIATPRAGNPAQTLATLLSSCLVTTVVRLLNGTEDSTALTQTLLFIRRLCPESSPAGSKKHKLFSCAWAAG